jgi:hypothetical protein
VRAQDRRDRMESSVFYRRSDRVREWVGEKFGVVVFHRDDAGPGTRALVVLGHECGDRDAQGAGNGTQVEKSHVALAPFHGPDEGAVQSAGLTELSLGQAPRGPALAHPVA